MLGFYCFCELMVYSSYVSFSLSFVIFIIINKPIFVNAFFIFFLYFLGYFYIESIYYNCLNYFILFTVYTLIIAKYSEYYFKNIYF